MTDLSQKLIQTVFSPYIYTINSKSSYTHVRGQSDILLRSRQKKYDRGASAVSLRGTFGIDGTR